MPFEGSVETVPVFRLSAEDDVFLYVLYCLIFVALIHAFFTKRLIRKKLDLM